jgi:hypothetical protein
MAGLFELVLDDWSPILRMLMIGSRSLTSNKLRLSAADISSTEASRPPAGALASNQPHGYLFYGCLNEANCYVCKGECTRLK